MDDTSERSNAEKVTKPMLQVTATDITTAIRTLNLSGLPVCVHSSLRSFGLVDGGAATIVAAFLGEGCSILVPSFSENFGTVLPSPGRWLERNATSEAFYREIAADSSWRYSTTSVEVDDDMGAISAEVVRHPERVRGNHPRDSFTALGPLAHALIDGQEPLDVYAPIRALAERNGAVIMMGVGLTCLTLVHEAERQAGRQLFRRWGRDALGSVVECEEGGCSAGYEKLRPHVAAFERQIRVGASLWRIFPAAETLNAASQAIRENPDITRCAKPSCERCDDTLAGGPILPDEE